MKIKNALILFFLFKVSLGFSQDYITGSFSYKSCFLQDIKIEGETNINQFALSFDNSSNDYVTVAEKNILGRTKKSIIEFQIPVRAFKGNNPLMVNDFQHLLDSKNHPLIIVEIEKKILENVYSKQYNSKMNFRLTIAGKTRNVTGDYNTYINDDGVILSGSAILKLSDFSIEPPQKMFGMLQVKDIIIIKFDILISSTNS